MSTLLPCFPPRLRPHNDIPQECCRTIFGQDINNARYNCVGELTCDDGDCLHITSDAPIDLEYRKVGTTEWVPYESGFSNDSRTNIFLTLPGAYRVAESSEAQNARVCPADGALLEFIFPCDE